MKGRGKIGEGLGKDWGKLTEWGYDRGPTGKKGRETALLDLAAQDGSTPPRLFPASFIHSCRDVSDKLPFVAGIRPADAPGFIGAQFIGAILAVLFYRWLARD